MTKRFSFVLPAVVAEQFYRAFPNQGDRSQLLRSYVYKLIQKTRPMGGSVTLEQLIEQQVDQVGQVDKEEKGKED